MTWMQKYGARRVEKRALKRRAFIARMLQNWAQIDNAIYIHDLSSPNESLSIGRVRSRRFTVAP